MDDEECLPESSSMNTYLQNLGFSDLQVIKNEGGSLINNIKASLAKLHLPVKVIDKVVIDQIEVIVSTKLLFEEDFSFVEILLSNFQVLNNEIPEIMYQDYSTGIVIFLGFCLYLVIGYYALVIISIFYAHKCANNFKRKQFDKFEVKNLVKVLRRNSSLLKKIVDFIKIKRDKYLWLQANHTELSFQENEINFYFYSKFKSDFLSITDEMINILLYSTQQLIKKIPLIDYADIPEYYLCSHFEKNFNFDDPSKLYLLYMLVQSEFLRRIILTLIPPIHAMPKNNFKLKKVIRGTTQKVTKLNITLQHKFDLAFRQVLQKQFELTKTKSPANGYAGEFISSIHDATNTFTEILLKCRLIEKSLRSGTFPQNIEANLVTLQSAIKNCQRNIENSLILLKKANSVSDNLNEVMAQKEEIDINDDKKNVEKCSLENNSTELQNTTKGGVNLQEEEIATSDENLSKIKIGDTNFVNVIEDDVFEMYISKENQNADLKVDDWDLDEVLKNKLKKEFSQSVMKELKDRLVEKAKNWKKREMNVLRKKGLIDNNNEELSKGELNEVGNKTEPKAETTESCCDEVYFEKPKHLDPKIKNLFSETAIKKFEEEETQSYFGSACKDFLKDLSETRKLILTAPTAEEEFCLCSTDEEMFDDKSTELKM